MVGGQTPASSRAMVTACTWARRPSSAWERKRSTRKRRRVSGKGTLPLFVGMGRIDPHDSAWPTQNARTISAVFTYSLHWCRLGVPASGSAEQNPGGGTMKVLRSRAPEQVRRDALAMAERKGEAGCEPCAEAYLDLARQQGASEQEVDHARRRLFMRAGALAGAGLAVSLLDVPGVLADQRQPARVRLESVST